MIGSYRLVERLFAGAKRNSQLEQPDNVDSSNSISISDSNNYNKAAFPALESSFQSGSSRLDNSISLSVVAGAR